MPPAPKPPRLAKPTAQERAFWAKVDSILPYCPPAECMDARTGPTGVGVEPPLPQDHEGWAPERPAGRIVRSPHQGFSKPHRQTTLGCSDGSVTARSEPPWAVVQDARSFSTTHQDGYLTPRLERPAPRQAAASAVQRPGTVQGRTPMKGHSRPDQSAPTTPLSARVPSSARGSVRSTRHEKPSSPTPQLQVPYRGAHFTSPQMLEAFGREDAIDRPRVQEKLETHSTSGRHAKATSDYEASVMALLQRCRPKAAPLVSFEAVPAKFYLPQEDKAAAVRDLRRRSVAQELPEVWALQLEQRNAHSAWDKLEDQRIIAKAASEARQAEEREAARTKDTRSVARSQAQEHLRQAEENRKARQAEHKAYFEGPDEPVVGPKTDEAEARLGRAATRKRVQINKVNKKMLKRKLAEEKAIAEKVAMSVEEDHAKRWLREDSRQRGREAHLKMQCWLASRADKEQPPRPSNWEDPKQVAREEKERLRKALKKEVLADQKTHAKLQQSLRTMQADNKAMVTEKEALSKAAKEEIKQDRLQAERAAAFEAAELQAQEAARRAREARHALDLCDQIALKKELRLAYT